MQRQKFVLSLVFLFFSISLSATSATNRLEVTGTVTENGNPVSGFTVVVANTQKPANTFTTATNTSGAYAGAFFNIISPVADVGDTISVNVTSSTGAPFGSNSAVYSAGSSMVINVSVTVTPPTPEAPTAPTNLIASFGENYDRVSLSWSDNSNNETGFEIQKSVSGSAYNALVAPSANTSSYNDVFQITEGITYAYRVRAVNAAGASAWSNESSVVKAIIITLPPAPTNVALTVNSATSISASWQNNATNADSVKIEQAAGNDNFNLVATLASNAVSFTANNLSENTVYRFRVGAENSVGINWSAPASVSTPSTIPAVPGNLTAVASSTTSVSLAWTDNSSNETSFEIRRKIGTGIFVILTSLAANTVSYVDSGLTPDTSYTYNVRASNAAGASSWTTDIVATTMPVAPNAPTALTAVANSPNAVTLTWQHDGLNTTAIKIEQSAPNSPWSSVANLAPGATSTVISGLAENTTYRFRVGAENIVGTSWSQDATVTTPYSSPLAPSNLAATPTSSSSITLSWQNNATNALSVTVEYWTASVAHTSIPLALTATSTTISSLNTNTAYTLRVGAVNPAGTAWSGEITATTPANPSAPEAPTAVIATATSPTTVTITWQHSGLNTTAIKVEKTVAGVASVAASLAGTATTATISGLSENTNYSFRVGAENAIGTTWSGSVNITTPVSSPLAPTNLNAVATSPTTITLSWQNNAVNATGIKVERATGPGAFAEVVSLGSTVTTSNFIGLSENTIYRFRVGAVNNATTSWSSETSASTPVAMPLAPTNLSASGTTTSGTLLTWTDNSSNEDGFEIQRKIGNGSFSALISLSANATSYQNSGLAASTVYGYRVRSFRFDTGSGWSNEITVTTLSVVNPPVQTPGAPTNLFGSNITSSGVTLSWSDNSSIESGFVIERSLLNGAFNQIAVLNANVTAYRDEGLQPSVTYLYRVKAVGAGGSSDWTSASITTAVVVVIVNPPVTQVAPPSPQNFKASWAKGDKAVKLSWESGSNPKSFLIYKSEGNGPMNYVSFASGDTRHYDDASALSFDIEYTYSIVAEGDNGAVSAPAVTKIQLANTKPEISVKFSMETVKNGDAFTIFVDAKTESNLTIMADVSLLDSTKSDPIALKEDPVSKGSYRAAIVIDRQNESLNGEKLIAVTVEDALGNSVTASDTVVLQNVFVQNLSLHAGTNFININIRSEEIKRLSDVFTVLGGPDFVSVIIGLDKKSNKFVAFTSAVTAGSPVDKAITGSDGLIVVMKKTKSLRLSGTPMPDNKIVLQKGVNFVGIPRNDPSIKRLSDVAKKSPEISVIVYEENSKFLAFVAESGAGDSEISANGRGLIIVAKNPVELTFSGPSWTDNEIFAAPLKPADRPLKSNSPVFVVSGTVSAKNNIPLNGVKISALNTRTNETFWSETEIAGNGAFQIVSFSLNVNSQVREGDIFRFDLFHPEYIGETAFLQINPTMSLERNLTVNFRLEKSPSETVLLQNFPNPFNPETWIPFQLKETGQVHIEIFSLKGEIVRTLNLGILPAGSYVDKTGAAYWDGKNSFGERVASGEYFYRIKAGEYSSMKRLIVLK